MPDYLGALGIMFFMFFLVAAATEAVLEAFRGALERLGFNWLKPNKSLDDAVAIATEFLPDPSKVRGQIAALQEIVGSVNDLSSKAGELTFLLDRTNNESGNNIAEGSIITQVNSMTMKIKDYLDKAERHRIFLLRMLAGAIAITLSYAADIDAIRAMIQANPKLFSELPKSTIWIWFGGHAGIILTGIAAASGSSYWHDKLDKVRNLKSVQAQMQRLAGSTA